MSFDVNAAQRVLSDHLPSASWLRSSLLSACTEILNLRRDCEAPSDKLDELREQPMPDFLRVTAMTIGGEPVEIHGVVWHVLDSQPLPTGDVEITQRIVTEDESNETPPSHGPSY